MASKFEFNDKWRLLICKTCQRSLPPTASGQEYHLRHAPHFIKGDQLSTLLGVFKSYGEISLPEKIVVGKDPIPAIPHLPIVDISICSLCDWALFFKSQKPLTTHVTIVHEIPARLQTEGVHFRRAKGQTFYSENKYVDYFEVYPPAPDTRPPTIEPHIQAFFEDLKAQRAAGKAARQEAHNKVDGFEAHKSEVIPWLDRTGIAMHLRGLPLDSVIAATQIGTTPATADSACDDLRLHVLEATDIILETAHKAALPGTESEMSFQTSLAICQFTPHASTPDSRGHAFLPKKSPAALRANFRYWKQFIVYYMDVMFWNDDDDDYWWPKHDKPEGCVCPMEGFTQANDEIDRWNEVVVASSEQPEEERKATLARLLPLLFKTMICHETGSNAFSSVLVSYAAMLAIKPSTKTWKEPGDYNSHLSGILWVSQLLLFNYCVMRAVADTDEYGKRLKSVNHWVREVFGEYARHDSETPIGHLLNWRDLLFVVSRETMKVREAIWDEAQTTLTYGDTVLQMSDVSKLLINEYRQAYRTLYTELFLGAPDIVRMVSHMFKDNMREGTSGHSLLDSNEDWLPSSTLEEVIQNSASLSKLFVELCGNSTARWNEKAIDNYEASTQAFLRHLLVLIHIGSGQPLRSPEILSTKWKNTQNQTRNIFVLHNRVMLRVNYHKGLEATGRTKDNMRFLPGPIGDLLLDFLVYVQPLRLEFLKQSCPNEELTPFLWSKGFTVWQDGQVTSALEKACSQAEIPRLHVSNWRQMTVAIVKAKFASDIQCFTLQPGDEVEDQGDEDIRAMNLQRNHSTMTANVSYANQHSFGGMSDEFIRNSLRASQLWATFFRIETELQINTKRLRSGSDSSFDDVDLVKRIAAGSVRRRPVHSMKELLLAMRKLYQDDTIKWRSPHQSWALETIMTWTEVVVAVLPTGAGKSLLFMLPCTLPRAETTIVILPLVSLRGDMLRRLQEMSIQVKVWVPGERPQTPLVLASVEAACTTDFRAYALSLIAAQKLDRIVVDECHLTVTASSYRASMIQLGEIRNLATQFVYLTATLPPSMEIAFNKRNYLVNPKIIRNSANRSNICYRLLANHSGKPLLEAAAALIDYQYKKDVVDHDYRVEDKVIIYCLSIKAVDELAHLLGCLSYTSESGSADEKGAILGRWLEDPGMPYIVATSALGAGLDYPYIRRVWHIDAPKSMIDFAQEAGRGGRDGRLSYSAIFLSPAWKPEELGTMEMTPRRAMHQFLMTNECLRKSLSAYLDDEENQIRMCPDEESRCQNCIRRERNPDSSAKSLDPTPTTVEPDFTGARLVRQQAKLIESKLQRFREDLLVLKGTCALCRGRNRDFDHLFEVCQWRFACLREKKHRLSAGSVWLKEYTACYWCLLPQAMCARPAGYSQSSDRSVTDCEFKDLVLPFCYSCFESDTGGEYLYAEYGVVIKTPTEFLNWLAKPETFAGMPSIMAVSFMADRLADMALY